MSNEYDVIVIGGGPAGYPAAIRAAQNKLKVACIDEWKNKDGTAVFGGTCTNAGCIPSKALLESSELYHKTKDELGVHGIKVSGVTFDVAQMQKRKTGIVKASTTGIAMLLKSAGVTALQGHGKLLAGRKVEFTAHDGKKEELSAKHIVLASRLDSHRTEEHAVRRQEHRRFLGCARFRSRAEETRRGRRRCHRPRARQRLAASRRGSRGARSARHFPADRRPGPREGSRAAFQEAGPRHQARRESLGREVHGSSVSKSATPTPSGSQTITVDKLIVAIGRRPFTKNLLADGTGVQLDERGFIKVDDHCKTGVENVWAVGDCVRGPMLAHKAKDEGVMVGDLIAGRYGHMNYNTIPR